MADYIIDAYRKMKLDEQSLVKGKTEKYIRMLCDEGNVNDLSDLSVSDQHKILKHFKRKILSSSFKDKFDKDLTLSVFSKLKELLS